jgi:hypothetical protein
MKGYLVVQRRWCDREEARLRSRARDGRGRIVKTGEPNPLNGVGNGLKRLCMPLDVVTTGGVYKRQE